MHGCMSYSIWQAVVDDASKTINRHVITLLAVYCLHCSMFIVLLTCIYLTAADATCDGSSLFSFAACHVGQAYFPFPQLSRPEIQIRYFAILLSCQCLLITVSLAFKSFNAISFPTRQQSNALMALFLPCHWVVLTLSTTPMTFTLGMFGLWQDKATCAVLALCKTLSLSSHLSTTPFPVFTFSNRTKHGLLQQIQPIV